MAQPDRDKYSYPIRHHVRAAQAVGMSLQDIADLCGVARGTVSQWSNGKSSPQHRVVERTAGAAKAIRLINDDLNYIRIILLAGYTVAHVRIERDVETTPQFVTGAVVTHAADWVFRPYSAPGDGTPAILDALPSFHYAEKRRPERPTYEKWVRSCLSHSVLPGLAPKFPVLRAEPIDITPRGVIVTINAEILWLRILSMVAPTRPVYDDPGQAKPDAFYGIKPLAIPNPSTWKVNSR